RLLAAELGIPLNKVTRDPRTGETRTPADLAKNPNGRVPTLEEDGFVLWESPAILKYLAVKRPERALCGGDQKTQALVDQWMCWWIGGAEAAIDTLAWEMIIKPKVFNQPRQRSRHHRRCTPADRPISACARQAARWP